MICFSEGGHYLGFFRRILIKVEHLVSIFAQSVREEFKKLSKMVTSDTEWIQYNDTELKYVPDNWPGVIERCIENNFFSTVVFYEKLYSAQDDAEYHDSKYFAMKRNKLVELAQLANDLDKLDSSNMEDIYGQDEIENQRRMMEEFERTRGQGNNALPGDIL